MFSINVEADKSIKIRGTQRKEEIGSEYRVRFAFSRMRGNADYG